MKRDVAAKTGVWYHGDDGPIITSQKFKTKLSISEIDSSENDVIAYRYLLLKWF